MYRLFGSKRVQPLEANPRELLRSFVTELDAQISRQSISVINDPAQFPMDKKKSVDSYIDYGLKSLSFLRETPAFRIRTSDSLLFSRTEVDSEEDPIHLCSPVEMIDHCLNLAVFVMHNKIANCFGF